MLEECQMSRIITILKNACQPFVIYLFGSVARGEMHEASDVDIAFWSDQEMNQYEVFCLAQEIANQVGREVDLVDLKSSSTVFQAQVIGTGKDIFCDDTYRRDQLEIRILKEYALLNEERQCILESVKERGKIYE